MRRSISTALRCITGLGLLAASAGAEVLPDTEIAELQALHQSRNFFALRERLEALPELPSQPAEVRFLEAVVQQAFNQPEASNQTIEDLLGLEELPQTLVLQLRNIRVTNELRLHRYSAALEIARTILASPVAGEDSAIHKQIFAKLSLLQALANFPPQETEIRGSSRLALGNTRRVPLKIQGRSFQFALDTGANFSVIMRSEAENLGLKILPASLVVSTSTAKQVLADVTVAEQVEIGKVLYRHAVFLVFPDELLTFPDGQRIPGLVGFPLVEAMGEVRFRRDNVLEIPKNPPVRTSKNLALDELEPLIQVRYGKDDLLCRLDTGAPQTVFYEPFFRRFQDRIESSGQRITAEAGGVGGMQEIPAYRLNKMTLTIAAAGVTLRQVDIYSQPIREPQDNFLFCNVGLDVLQQYRTYSINFRDMALVFK